MIEILPIIDENKLRAFCLEKNLEDGNAVMIANDGEENLGSISAIEQNGELLITSIESPYEWMLDGLIRAILAYGDNRYLKEASTTLVEQKTAFEKVGFKETDGVLKIEISKVVHNCK